MEHRWILIVQINVVVGQNLIWIDGKAQAIKHVNSKIPNEIVMKKIAFLPLLNNELIELN